MQLNDNHFGLITLLTDYLTFLQNLPLSYAHCIPDLSLNILRFRFLSIPNHFQEFQKEKEKLLKIRNNSLFL